MEHYFRKIVMYTTTINNLTDCHKYGWQLIHIISCPMCSQNKSGYDQEISIRLVSGAQSIYLTPSFKCIRTWSYFSVHSLGEVCIGIAPSVTDLGMNEGDFFSLMSVFAWCKQPHRKQQCPFVTKWLSRLLALGGPWRQRIGTSVFYCAIPTRWRQTSKEKIIFV